MGTLGKPFTHKHTMTSMLSFFTTLHNISKRHKYLTSKKSAAVCQIYLQSKPLPYPSRRTLNFLFVKHKSLAEMNFSHGLCTSQEWHTGGLSLLGEFVNPVEISEWISHTCKAQTWEAPKIQKRSSFSKFSTVRKERYRIAPWGLQSVVLLQICQPPKHVTPPPCLDIPHSSFSVTAW